MPQLSTSKNTIDDMAPSHLVENAKSSTDTLEWVFDSRKVEFIERTYRMQQKYGWYSMEMLRQRDHLRYALYEKYGIWT